MKFLSLSIIAVCSMAFIFGLNPGLEAKHHHHHHHHGHHHHHHGHHHHHSKGIHVTLETNRVYSVQPQVVVQQPVVYPATYVVYEQAPVYDYTISYGWFLGL